MITYRPFTPSDHNQLHSMIMGLYTEDAGGLPMTPEKIDRTIDYLTKNPQIGAIFMLKIDQISVGYSILIYYWSNEHGGIVVVLDELYVLPHYRRQGIATKYINSLERSRHNDAVAFELEVWPDNDQAKRLYQRLGFVPLENNLLTKRLV